MKFTSKNCFEKGFLRKIPSSEKDAGEDIKTAHDWISEAEKNILSKAYRSAIISSYLAMFHSVRAVLARDGVRERSHFCMGRYLEDFYFKKGLLEGKWIELFDYYRELRHADQYGTKFMATEKESGESLSVARDFVKRISVLLKPK